MSERGIIVRRSDPGCGGRRRKRKRREKEKAKAHLSTGPSAEPPNHDASSSGPLAHGVIITLPNFPYPGTAGEGYGYGYWEVE